MKKYIQSMMAFAAIVSFASCSSEDNNTTIENESATKVMTFTATQEGNEASTRAILSGTNIHWESEDKISIFDGTNNNQFTLTDGDGRTFGKFSGEAGQSTSYTAVYPYQENASLSGDDVTNVTLPATQNATANSFDKNAALMMAKSNSTTLNFKNAISLVKVTTQFACKKIVLSANEEIAGTGTLTMTFDNANDNYTSSFTFNSGNSKTITLKPATGESFGAGTYYIVVPPITLTNGFTITFTAEDDKEYTRKSNKSTTFNRSRIKDLGEFATTGDYWYDAARGDIVKADQEVDMGVFEINGKNYRLIFAKSNLTANGLAANESDFGDYFAWGAKEPWLTSYTYDGVGHEDASFTNKNWKPGKENGYTEANAPTLSKTYNANEVLSSSDDAARWILGGNWQIPTQAIWQALYDANRKTVNWGTTGKMKFDTISGINGMKISKKDDPNTYIFLPAAGSVGTEFVQVGDYGPYWSGTAKSSTEPYYLYFGSGAAAPKYSQYLYYVGIPVRPVRLVEVSLAGRGQGETEGIEEDVFKY